MIFFLPGCYGNYLTKCLYVFTHLNQETPGAFTFGTHGHSHDFAKNSAYNKVIGCFHYGTTVDLPEISPETRTVCLTANAGHRLDYYDNQFAKLSNLDIKQHLPHFFDHIETSHKLLEGWRPKNLSDPEPWIVREWCSFWLPQCLREGYNVPVPDCLSKDIVFDCQQLFHDFVEVFVQITLELDLKITCPLETIKKTHTQFLALQTFNGMQDRCEKFVGDVLSDACSLSPCQTIFDQAYVQSLLRDRGHELYCDGLDAWPGTARELQQLLHR